MTTYLLDTHVAVWLTSEQGRIATSTLERFQAPGADLLVRIASVWEAAIKKRLGKLAVADDWPDQLARAGVKMAPITAEQTWEARRLPLLHRDPFDRLLVIQALGEGPCW